jgi:hypothetical protein
MTESRRRTKEAKSRIVNGVAGLSMATTSSSRVCAAQSRPGLARKEKVGSRRCDPEDDGTGQAGG